MRHGPIFGSILFALTAAGLGAQGTGPPLTLDMVVAKLLEQSPQAVISRLSVSSAYNSYRSQWAQALPQITLNLDPAYSVNLTKYPDLTLDTSGIPYKIVTQSEDQTNRQIGEGVSITQALPTAGNLSLSLRNNTTISETSTGGTTTSVISQAPKLSLTISQPVFVNDKLIDMELFPASLKSTELPYLKTLQQDVSVRNSVVTQGVSTYLTVVGLRKQLEQMKLYKSVLEESLERSRLAQANGSATENVVWSAELAVDRQAEAILELRYSLLQSERALARSIGSTSTLASTPFSDAIPSIPIKESPNQLFAKVAQENPEVVQGRLDVENARMQSIIGGQTYAPNLMLSLSVSPQYGDNRPDSNLFENSISQLFDKSAGAYNDVTFSVGMQVPVYNGGRYKKDKAALDASVRVAETNLASKLGTLRDNLDSLFLKQQYLSEKVSLTEGNLRLEERRLADQNRLLGLSRATDLDVKSAEAELEARRNDLWNVRVDLFLNSLDILSIAGNDLSKLITKDGIR